MGEPWLHLMEDGHLQSSRDSLCSYPRQEGLNGQDLDSLEMDEWLVQYHGYPRIHWPAKILEAATQSIP